MNEDSNFKSQESILKFFQLSQCLFEVLTFYALSVWKLKQHNGISFGPAEMFRNHYSFSKGFRSLYRFLF